MITSLLILNYNEKLGSKEKRERDRAAVLAIAYHNMGVEQEFIKMYDAAILSYLKAVNFASAHLGEDDSITTNLRQVYENANNELVILKKKKRDSKKGQNDQSPMYNENYGSQVGTASKKRGASALVTPEKFPDRDELDSAKYKGSSNKTPKNR